ncbi:MAG: tripartite tricarboxylate transporter substrate binding protein [Proteobacteria bacterium]|nr:tripartite tricarboxylate transporter substrate binding protein [Burkholderiales bacterium]
MSVLVHRPIGPFLAYAARAVSVAVLAAGTPAALAQAATANAATPGAVPAYPQKPVRLIVPYPPGGPTDIVARAIAARLPEQIGQPFIIDNRAGASGLIGAEVVARAAPDGYTLLVNTSIHVITPSLLAKMPFDALRDFTHVTLLSRVPLLLVVPPGSSARSVRDLIDIAKANPGKLNFASSSTGGGSHLAGELFKSAAGIVTTHVPYKGSTPALADVMGGHVDFMFDTTLTTLPLVKGGKLRALAISTRERAPSAPDLPTVAEAGVAGYDASNWYALWGPARMAAALTQRIQVEVAKALAYPAVRDRMIDLGAEPVGNTPAQFEAFAQSEFTKWASVVKHAGLKPE